VEWIRAKRPNHNGYGLKAFSHTTPLNILMGKEHVYIAKVKNPAVGQKIYMP
jgi:hypothetical protein